MMRDVQFVSLGKGLERGRLYLRSRIFLSKTEDTFTCKQK